jgi:hypothetical protein
VPGWVSRSPLCAAGCADSASPPRRYAGTRFISSTWSAGALIRRCSGPAWPATSRPPAPANPFPAARAPACPQPGRDTHHDQHDAIPGAHRVTVSARRQLEHEPPSRARNVRFFMLTLNIAAMFTLSDREQVYLCAGLSCGMPGMGRCGGERTPSMDGCAECAIGTHHSGESKPGPGRGSAY